MTKFKRPSKKDQLLSFIRALRYVKTSEVISWGSKHYSNRSERDARQLCKEGLIERMNEGEKIRRFGRKMAEGVWEAI